MTDAACANPPAGSTVSVYDGATGATLEGGDWARLADGPFRSFVAGVCQHLSGRGVTDACGEARPGGPTLRLVFIHRPLVAPLNAVAPPPPELADTAECRLDTPWLTVRAHSTPHPALHARLIWSERQILLDQALLAGMPAQATEPAPLPPDVFARHAEDYATTVVGTAGKQTAQAAVAGRIPPGLLWLFRHSVQSTRAPFSTYAIAALHRVMGEAAPGYIALVAHLLDRCLGPDAAGGRYADILHLPPGMEPGQYRIERRN